MKQRLLIFCLIALPMLALAQAPQNKNFHLAFTISPTFGWMEFPNGTAAYKNVKNKVQTSYGIIGDFGFSSNYFFSSGFTLTTVGSAVNVSLPQGSQVIDYKIQYMEIPLTLKLKSNEAPVRYYGQFGLDAGVKVSTKHTITSLDIPRNANLLRLGLVLGSGAEWHLTQNMHVLTGVSYNKGFTKVFSSPDTKNSFVVLNLGVFF